MAHARKKILCVEDDRETAALIAEKLVERGFEVRAAHNGQEGLLAILKDKPNLVLCDVSMPIWDRISSLSAGVFRLRWNANTNKITEGKSDGWSLIYAKGCVYRELCPVAHLLGDPRSAPG